MMTPQINHPEAITTAALAGTGGQLSMSAVTEPQTSPQPHTSPLDTPRAKNIALLLLAMTQFVVVIDASIVNVALPSIGQALHFPRTDL